MEKFNFGRNQHETPSPSLKENDLENLDKREKELEMGNFYTKNVEAAESENKRISLEALAELKEKGITTENFLDYICQKHGKLLHGSIHEISEGKLKSNQGKIFASNKSAIAILKSIYSNRNVELEYPDFINKETPLELTIHTPENGAHMKNEEGFIYLLDGEGFRNDPEGS